VLWVLALNDSPESGITMIQAGSFRGLGYGVYGISEMGEAVAIIYYQTLRI